MTSVKVSHHDHALTYTVGYSAFVVRLYASSTTISVVSHLLVVQRRIYCVGVHRVYTAQR